MRWARAKSVIGLGLAAIAWAQTAAGTRPVGTIVKIDPAARRLSLKTDAGPGMTVLLPEGINILRVAPGEKDLSRAERLTLGDLAPGDRILVRGKASTDGASIEAATVVVMTRADLTKKQEAEKADWDRRGISGTIASLNPASREIAVSMRTLGAAKTVTVGLEKAVLRRYAPDSVRFADALPGRFEDLQVGDQVRARGERSADGTRLEAEELVSGTFRNIAATVKSIDAAHDALLITDLDSKQPVSVRIKPDTSLRRMPPMAAQFLAARLHGGGQPPGAAAGARPRPEGARGPGGAEGPRGPGGPPDFQRMLERMPAATLAELKPGDALIISSTVGVKTGEITAITIVAGVEPILTAPSADRQVMLGSWNFEMNMNLP